MNRLCIKEFRLNGLIFAKGCEYKVNYNHVDGRIYISNPFGFTDIPKEILNTHFL